MRVKYSIWFIISLFVLVLLVSCNTNEDPAPENETDEQDQVEEENNSGEDNTNQEEDPAPEQDLTTPEEDTGDEQTDPEPVEQPEEELEAQYEISSVWSVKPLTEDANEKVALLTIDDAPDTYALEMAHTLKELNVPAIFFVNGHFIDTDEEKQVLKQIHEMGFEIGNHTYNHTRLSTISEEEQKEEILSLSKLIEEIIGEKPKYFRAPNGVNTDFSTQLVKDEGMLQMNWTYGYDWNSDYMSEEAIADIMVNTPLLSNGANLLMHDREWTAAALDDIVIGLREKGYEFVDPKLLKLPE
ncbi:polysaccharide deacetylase family protein [Radiobacillus sp. PE A8.2]|uniref:polysaccharide deacetylase family protein n=1 Tax=Radiobacillus sp. PE A8.2 TaxID=3380349 RepID=UPI00388F24B4